MVAKNISSKTCLFLTNASMLYRDTCPEQARFLMKRHQMDGPALPDSASCPFCFQWRQPGGYSVRVRPKRPASPQVMKLLRWEAANRRLSAHETKVLQKFRRSSSVLMATCHTCHKTSKQTGVNREFLAAISKSPVSTGKCKTPQSAKGPASKSGSHQKTPSSTQASRSSETPSSSRSARDKKSAFSRLKKLLMLEDSQKTKKGGLKDFLSSL